MSHYELQSNFYEGVFDFLSTHRITYPRIILALRLRGLRASGCGTSRGLKKPAQAVPGGLKKLWQGQNPSFLNGGATL